jgi:pimeloyl-ACP methyl ester carboxylesterase
VLAAFRQDSEAWEVAHGRVRLIGNTWGQGPPLYVLGGFAGSSEQFAFLSYLLREDVRCVVCEHRPAGRFDLGDLASDLLAVADAHGDRQFAVYATSFGSLVALRGLLDAPERIPRAILACGFAACKLSRTERLLASFARRLPGRIGSVPGRFAVETHNHRPWFPPFDHVRWNFYLEDSGRTSLADFAARAALARRHDLRDELPRIAQSVLTIRPEGEGRVLAAAREEIESRLPNVRCESLTSCGRLPHLTHPHRVAKLVREFVCQGEQEA